MSEITSDLVKTLRDKTGAGMMDCKKALSESGGDLDKAIDYLRKKGAATAEKRADRAGANLFGDCLLALDARTGKALWSFNTGQQITSQPITYTVDGKQFVAIANGSNVVSFARRRLTWVSTILVRGSKRYCHTRSSRTSLGTTSPRWRASSIRKRTSRG